MIAMRSFLIRPGLRLARAPRADPLRQARAPAPLALPSPGVPGPSPRRLALGDAVRGRARAARGASPAAVQALAPVVEQAAEPVDDGRAAAWRAALLGLALEHATRSRHRARTWPRRRRRGGAIASKLVDAVARRRASRARLRPSRAVRGPAGPSSGGGDRVEAVAAGPSSARLSQSSLGAGGSGPGSARAGPGLASPFAERSRKRRGGARPFARRRRRRGRDRAWRTPSRERARARRRRRLVSPGPRPSRLQRAEGVAARPARRSGRAVRARRCRARRRSSAPASPLGSRPGRGLVPSTSKSKSKSVSVIWLCRCSTAA